MQMMSEQLDKLFEALAKAQGEMKSAKENAYNPFFKSNYADLNDIWDACRDPLKNNGLAVSQFIYTREEKYWIISILGHSSGQWIKSEFCLPLIKHDPQELGKQQTYCKRYALAGLVGVSTSDDDAEEAMESHRKDKKPFHKPVAPKEPEKTIDASKPLDEAPISQREADYLKELMLGYDDLRLRVLAHVGKPRVEEIPKHKYETIVNQIKTRLAEMDKNAV